MTAMSILRTLARHVTAGDLQHPFGPALSMELSGEVAHLSVYEAPYTPAPYHREIEEQMERICLISTGTERPTHYVWGIDIDTDLPLADNAKEIRPSDCATDSTPALTLMTEFLESPKPYRLILTETRLTGFVCWADLFKPEVNVCVLALLLEVEDKCAEALTWEPMDAEEAFARLSEGRQQKAREVYTRAMSRDNESDTPVQAEDLVYATTFVDKATMVGSLEQFAGVSRRQLEKEFVRMERTRNSLAHTRMRPTGELRELAEVIRSAEDVLRRLSPLSEQRGLRLVVSDNH
jgi:hypothetical protein